MERYSLSLNDHSESSMECLMPHSYECAPQEATTAFQLIPNKHNAADIYPWPA